MSLVIHSSVRGGGTGCAHDFNETRTKFVSRASHGTLLLHWKLRMLPYFASFCCSIFATTFFVFFLPKLRHIQSHSNAIHCFVCSSLSLQVSWVRRKDDGLNLITFGLHTYSSDSRYSLEYLAPNDWQLLIQFANERDEGHYECQLNSHPPIVLVIYLTVVGKYTHGGVEAWPGEHLTRIPNRQIGPIIELCVHAECTAHSSTAFAISCLGHFCHSNATFHRRP